MYAAWQRGQESVSILQNITPTQSATLKAPDEMNAILPAYIRKGTAEPQLKGLKRNGLSKRLKIAQRL